MKLVSGNYVIKTEEGLLYVSTYIKYSVVVE